MANKPLIEKFEAVSIGPDQMQPTMSLGGATVTGVIMSPAAVLK
ncbi:MAG: hypothetical protein DHS20C02_03070 [Micavibrio sp.]|nr:MAG: hypothetical protein DHS20C02_03070 [Micavibrio sp.]